MNEQFSLFEFIIYLCSDEYESVPLF